MPGNIFSDKDRLVIRQYHPRLKPTPIPVERWNEGEQRCFSINAKWASHLVGLLSMLEQPDTWIGTEEECEDATQQATEIIAALSTGACPEPCPECPDCPECDESTCTGNGAGNGEEEFEYMPYLTGLHWEGSTLYMDFGPCCKQAVPSRGAGGGGGSGGTTNETPTIDDIIDDGTDVATPDKFGWEPAEGTAGLTCRKAYALGHAIHLLFTAIQESADMSPWDGIEHIKASNECMDITTLQALTMYGAVGMAQVASIIWTMNPVWGENVEQKLICDLAASLVPDTLAMTEDEWGIAWDCWRALVDNVSKQIFGEAWMQIKKSQWRTAISTYAYDDTADCDCPELPEPEVAPYDVLHFTSYKDAWGAGTPTVIQPTGKKVTIEVTLSHGSNPDAHSKTAGITVYVARNYAVPITEFVMAYEPLDGNILGTGDWNSNCGDLTYAPNVLWGNLNNNDFSSGFSGFVEENGIRYMRYYNNGNNLNWDYYKNGVNFNGQACPDNQTGIHHFKLHIVSVNGVNTGALPNPTTPW